MKKIISLLFLVLVIATPAAKANPLVVVEAVGALVSLHEASTIVTDKIGQKIVEMTDRIQTEKAERYAATLREKNLQERAGNKN